MASGEGRGLDCERVEEGIPGKGQRNEKAFLKRWINIYEQYKPKHQKVDMHPARA